MGHSILAFALLALLLPSVHAYFQQFEHTDVEHEVISPVVIAHAAQSLQVLLTFEAYDRNYSLRLRQNTDVLTRDFNVKVVGPEGEGQSRSLEEEAAQTKMRCKFYLSDEATTAATVSVCGATQQVSGLVSVDSSTLLIRFEHQNGNMTEGRHLIYHFEDIPCVQGGCLDTDPIQKLKDYARSLSPNLKGRVWSTDPTVTKKYLELSIVYDREALQRLEQSGKHVMPFTMEIINYITSMYSKLEISIVLKQLILWNKNPVSMYDDIEETLIALTDYLLENYDRKQRLDASLLLSGHRFIHSPGILGVAFKAKTCEMPELAVAIITVSSDAAVTDVAGIATHELGHSLGFDDEWYHVTSNRCYDQCLDAEDQTSCIMRGKYTGGSHAWSQCTKDKVKEREISQRFACLYNQPNVSQAAICGNGVIENTEQCDCPPNMPDCLTCCDQKTCMLKPGAVCSSEACCQSCQVVRSMTMCRHAIDAECDTSDFCDGRHAQCFDTHKADKTECEDNRWCISGRCEDKCLHNCYGQGTCSESNGDWRCVCQKMAFGKHCQSRLSANSLLEIFAVSFFPAFILTFLLFLAIGSTLRK